MSGSNSVCWGRGRQENRKHSMKRLSQQARQSESHAICDVCLPNESENLIFTTKVLTAKLCFSSILEELNKR